MPPLVMESQTLNLIAAITLQSPDGIAAAQRVPTLEIVAYTGGFMTVPGWGPLCIDLKGLEAGQVAVLADHDAKQSGVVGHGTASVEGGRLVVRGQMSADSEAARSVLAAARNGFPWQASVGLEVMESKPLRPRQTLDLNGRHLTVPDSGAVLVSRGKLREVSITALGCDDATVVNISAMQHQGDKCMEKTVETPDTQTADTQTELKRVATIRNLCGDRFPDIQAKALADGWDENRTELEILRASRPLPPSVYVRAHAPNSSVLEAALLLRMGKSGLGEKVLGPMAMEQADRMGVTNLIDVCRAALYADGSFGIVRSCAATDGENNCCGKVPSSGPAAIPSTTIWSGKLMRARGQERPAIPPGLRGRGSSGSPLLIV